MKQKRTKSIVNFRVVFDDETNTFSMCGDLIEEFPPPSKEGDYEIRELIRYCDSKTKDVSQIYYEIEKMLDYSGKHITDVNGGLVEALRQSKKLYKNK
jgi:hypothetical protein